MKSLELKTIGGDTVVLKYRDNSGEYEGGVIITGYFSERVGHTFKHGFWNIKGEAVFIHGLGDKDLIRFNLVDFSEKYIENIPDSGDLSFNEFFEMLLEKEAFREIFDRISDDYQKESVRDFYQKFFDLYKLSKVEDIGKYLEIICENIISDPGDIGEIEILEVAIYNLNENIHKGRRLVKNEF